MQDIGTMVGRSLASTYEILVGAADGRTIRFPAAGRERDAELVGANEGLSEGSTSIVAMDGNLVAFPEESPLGIQDGT